MTVFTHPRGITWRYDFWWNGKRYTGSTGQLTKDDAELVEAQIKLRVRQDAFGIAPLDRTATPSFAKWAEVHCDHVLKRKRVTRFDAYKRDLGLVLQFWGKRPTTLPDPEAMSPRVRFIIERQRHRIAKAPYHNLRLADPIIEPEWIEKFEDWMARLNLSGARKNQYRSAMSNLYRTALLPAFRKKSNVSANPFLHLERDRVAPRDVVLTLDQLRAWMAAAAPHVRLAMAIAAYAPELREASILKLRWDEHFDPDLTRIVNYTHKTAARTNRPQVIPIPVDLHRILRWAREDVTPRRLSKRRSSAPLAKTVIRYRGKSVASLKTGLRNAVARANETLPANHRIVYGAAHAGVTFHTIRHTIATHLAEMGMPEKIRQMVMGHESLSTTQRYTHLAAHAKKRPLEQLARRLNLTEAVQGPVQNSTHETSRNPNKVRRTSRKLQRSVDPVSS